MSNLKVFGNHDEGTLNQIKNCVEKGGVKGVLCADGHKGYAQPIGGVVAYDNAVSVSGVGYDIGCGNLAVSVDAKRQDLADLPLLMNDIAREVSFGVGRVRNEPLPPTLDEYFFSGNAWEIPLIKDLKQKAKDQLGTVGSGNHYVDIFYDDEDYLWIGVHFGSRGFGHQTATRFLKAAGAKDGIDVDPCVLSLDSELGKEYFAAMELAGLYAHHGRWTVVNKVMKMLGIEHPVHVIHNHHNFAWEEDGLVVVRKGSTPNRPFQFSFVGGSMGDDAVIIQGIDSEANKEALYSTVHGAGRIMSRTAAKGKFVKTPDGKKIRTQGLVRHDEMVRWLREKGVYLVGGDLDEAPQAYRRLPEVLAHHSHTFKILHTLHPIGVVMAGKDVVDPYKD
jgi:tRNA-splicing ligase RtcB